jgi:hypothetical protein
LRNLWIFSKSSFGVFVGNVCFLCKLANFRKKKTKTCDNLYKFLIILLYSWLHTGKTNIRFWQIFTILFSLVVIENLWKHLNLEFLTFNFIFDEIFLLKIKATHTMHLPNIWCQPILSCHPTTCNIDGHFFLVVLFLWAIWSFIFLLILFLVTVATKNFLGKHKN